MQTFLPYPDFAESARSLDRQRLSKQRVETKQIITALLGTGSGGWSRHPAVRMWRGHEPALAAYGTVICVEWRSRGYRDTLLEWFTDKLAELTPHGRSDVTPPTWLGDEAFHRSHRSNLLRKNPTHYRPLWPAEPDDLPYIWPGA